MTVRIASQQPRRWRGLRSPDFTLRMHTDPTNANKRTAHFYAKRELADEAVEWLVPWCSWDTAYPERHDRGELRLSGFSDAEWCPDCTQRGR